jgi:HAD superfamily hydrolase (TIGR01509 family)
MSQRAIDVVLFDLGGVLYDPGGVAPMRQLAGIDSDEELWSRWLSCRWVRDYERGQCTSEEFAAGVVDDWQLHIDPAAFLTAFAGWTPGPYAGAEDLVRATRAVVPVGCLSNTNALHWNDHFSRWSVLDEIDYRFLSFELGHVKPDRAIFNAVADQLPVPPGRVLFIDDNTINVNGARQAGFQATRAQGVDAARKVLADAGVL